MKKKKIMHISSSTFNHESAQRISTQRDRGTEKKINGPLYGNYMLKKPRNTRIGTKNFNTKRQRHREEKLMNHYMAIIC